MNWSDRSRDTIQPIRSLSHVTLGKSLFLWLPRPRGPQGQCTPTCSWALPMWGKKPELQLLEGFLWQPKSFCICPTKRKLLRMNLPQERFLASPRHTGAGECMPTIYWLPALSHLTLPFPYWDFLTSQINYWYQILVLGRLLRKPGETSICYCDY